MVKHLSIVIGTALTAAFLGACGSKAPTRVTMSSKGGAFGSKAAGSNAAPNGTSSGSSIPVSLTCTPNATVDPGPSPIRRLTRQQYVNSVSDLYGALPILSTVLTSQTKPSALGLTMSDVSQVEVEDYRTAANAIAAALVADSAKLKAIANCDAVAVKRDCAKIAIKSLGLKAYRAPLADTDVNNYLGLYDIGAKTSHEHGMELMLGTLIQSPRFLYQVETGTAETNGPNAVKLSGYEVATRLAFALWDTIPNDKLLAAAAAGQLNTADGVKAQFTWMLQDPKGKNLLNRFLQEWMRISDIDTKVKNSDLYPDWNNAAFKAGLQKQASAFFDDIIANKGSKLSSLLTSTTVMVNKDIGSLYGVTGADVTFKPLERTDGFTAGLLTLPAVLALAASTSESSPTYRGRFVRNSLLCQQLASAPANIPAPKAVTAATSTRDRLSQHVTDPSCSGCHKLTDPVGFGFENYDAIGKFRATDGGAPVDASGEIFNATGIEGTFNGVAELGRKLAGSPQVEECVTRQWFRFIQSRFEKDVDVCALRAAADSFKASGTDLNVLPANLIGTDAFLYRRPIKN